jgi:hypothetical protein
MATRQIGFALCIENRGAQDLDVRKVYRVVHDKAAAATGYVRVIDESGEDYLYPADYFVSVELPARAKRALATQVTSTNRRRSSRKFLRPASARAARSRR